MNLADRIIAQREKQDTQHVVNQDFDAGEVDDCGIPFPLEVTYDYLCARTMKAHPQLYKRGDNIFEIGRIMPIQRRREDAIWYCGLNHELLKNGGHVIYWRRLLQLLPELSNDKIKITDSLYWDKVEGRLEKEEKMVARKQGVGDEE